MKNFSIALVAAFVCLSGCTTSPGVEYGNQNSVPDASAPDTDLDGVADDRDNCPWIRNPNQADFDGDGTGDACDGCPTDELRVNPTELNPCAQLVQEEEPDAGHTAQDAGQSPDASAAPVLSIESVTVAGPSEAQALEVHPGDEVDVAKFKVRSLSGQTERVTEMYMSIISDIAERNPFNHDTLKVYNAAGYQVGTAYSHVYNVLRVQFVSPFNGSQDPFYDFVSTYADTLTFRGPIKDNATAATLSIAFGGTAQVDRDVNGVQYRMPVIFAPVGGDFPLGDDDEGSNWIRVVPNVEVPDAGQMAADAGNTTDAGNVILDPQCADNLGSPTKAYLRIFEPYDYAYADGRPGAKVIEFYVASCDETISMTNLQVQIGQYEESAQHPQSPDDATGLLLPNGQPAFTNESLSYYAGNSVAVSSVTHGDSADDSAFTYFNLQSPIVLGPHQNMTFTVSLDITANPALAGQEQVFHFIPQVRFNTETFPNGYFGIPFTNGSGEWPRLTVQYGGTLAGSIDVISVPGNVSPTQLAGAQGAPIGSFDLWARGADVVVQELGFVILDKDGNPLANGDHTFDGILQLSENGQSLLNAGAADPFIYGGGCTISSEIVSLGTPTCGGVTNPSAWFLSRYLTINAGTSKRINFAANISSNATENDSYTVQVTYLKYVTVATGALVTSFYSSRSNPAVQVAISP